MLRRNLRAVVENRRRRPRSLAPGTFQRIIHIPHSHRRRRLLFHHARKFRRLRRFLRRVRQFLMSSRPRVLQPIIRQIRLSAAPNRHRARLARPRREFQRRFPHRRARSPSRLPLLELRPSSPLRVQQVFLRVRVSPPRREELLLIVLVHLEVLAQRALAMVLPLRRRLARRAVAVAADARAAPRAGPMFRER